MRRSILFDLDGTLIETAPAILSSFSAAFHSLGLAVPNETELRSTIGQGLNQVLTSFYPSLTLDQQSRAIEVFRKHYETDARRMFYVYDGVTDLLRHLQAAGFGLFVVTSKPAEYAKRQLQIAEIADYFDVIIGGNLDERKWFEGKLSRIRRTVKKYNIDISVSALVGDRGTDIKMAKDIGLFSVGAGWGYGTEQELRDAGADFIASQPQKVAVQIEHLLKVSPRYTSAA